MRVVLDLDAGIDRISGTLTCGPAGDTRAFHGTLELLAALEAILATVAPDVPEQVHGFVVGADSGADYGGASGVKP